MARTRANVGGAHAIRHAYYSKPQPPQDQPERPSSLINDGYLRNQKIGGLNGDIVPMVLGGGSEAENVILLPIDYIYNPDDQDDYWREQPSGYQASKTSIAYEKPRGDHPGIARYISRDPWAGLPILARPTGPALEEFIEHHKQAMYLEGAQGSAIIQKFLPLALSALAFNHSHNDFYYNDLTFSNCWLSTDFSLSVVGFLNSEFRDEWGQLHHGHGLRLGPKMRLTHVTSFASVKTDLFDWGTFVYQLMTSEEPGGDSERQIIEQIRARRFPIVSSELLGRVIKKCWTQQYADASEVRRDLLNFLSDRGYTVAGDTIQNFHHENIPLFAVESW
jgi:hypothetical protein